MSKSFRRILILAAVLAAGGADAGIRVQRAVAPLTHEAVARAYPANVTGYPAVGDPAAASSNRWADLVFRYHFTLTNDGPKTAAVRVLARKPADFGIATEFRSEPDRAELAPGQVAGVTLVVRVPGEAAAALPGGYARNLEVRFTGEVSEGGTQKTVFWVPAIAKILAGADGKGIPADVLPPGADYADEFSGGWNGVRFTAPFVTSTRAQIEAMRKMMADGVKPHRYPYGQGDLSKSLEAVMPDKISDKRHHTEHLGFATAILDLALRWAHTGEERFAVAARDLILAYVARAERLGHGQEGRVGENGLSEAWFCNLVFQGYDLFAGTGLFTPDQRKKIEAWMLYEAGVIRPSVFAYSNMQCEENFAIMAAGLVAGDFKYLRFAYYPPYGMEGQLSGAFYADGFHRETQAGYHYRSINPIADQAEALLRLGFCVYDERLHRALMNPVRCTMGPGDDLGGQDIQACQVAWLRYRDPLAVDWLVLTRKQDRLPLHYGGQPLPAASGAYWRTPGLHLPASGQTVLRAHPTPDDLRALTVHWGKSEKRQALDFMDYRLFYRARPFGGGQFGICETLGHNCVIVNEHTASTPGVPVEMDLEGAFPYVVAVNPGPKPMVDTELAQPWPYPWPWADAGDTHDNFLPLAMAAKPGKRWREWTPMVEGAVWSRTVAVIEGGFLIADRVELDAAGRLERPLHLGGALVPLLELENVSVPLTPVAGVLGEASAYRAAQPATPTNQAAEEGTGVPVFPRGKTDDSWSAVARMQGCGAKVHVLGEPGTEVIQVHSLKGSWGKANPFLLLRRDDVRHTRFVVFIEPFGEWEARTRDTGAAPRIRGMKRLEVTAPDGRARTDREAAALELDFGDKRVVVLLNDSGRDIKAGGLRTGKRFAAGEAGYTQQEQD